MKNLYILALSVTIFALCISCEKDDFKVDLLYGKWSLDSSTYQIISGEDKSEITSDHEFTYIEFFSDGTCYGYNNETTTWELNDRILTYGEGAGNDYTIESLTKDELILKRILYQDRTPDRTFTEAIIEYFSKVISKK